DRHHGGDPAPFLPAVEAAQVVGAHDPDESHPGAAAAQIGDGLVAIACADLRLEADDVDPGMPRKRAGGQNALLERRQPARVLERIAGGYQPPDPIEIEALHRQQTGGEMRVVRRIERAAEQADAHSRGMRWKTDVAAGHALSPDWGRTGRGGIAGRAHHLRNDTPVITGPRFRGDDSILFTAGSAPSPARGT